MSIVLRLLVVVVLAAFAAGPGAGVHGPSPGVVHAASIDEAGADMADCGACISERMDAGTIACGTMCGSAAVVAVELEQPYLAALADVRFPSGEIDLAGRGSLPEPTPPKQS